MGTKKRQIHSESIDADHNLNTQPFKRGPEWINIRKQCIELKMDQCYQRYIERLIVANTALFLFIIELVLLLHMLALIILQQSSFLIMLPFLTLLVFLPFLRYFCLKKSRGYQHYRLRIIIFSCIAALSVVLMDVLFIHSGSEGYSYDHITITSVYFLLPISFFGKPYLLGIGISLFYFVCNIVETILDSNQITLSLHGGYVIYLSLLNGAWMGFRTCLEYHLRLMILNRRQLLHHNLVLKATLIKEAETMNTVVPAEIAPSLKNEIQKRIADQDLRKRYLHPVMINYAHLAEHLNVMDLVQKLHELILHFELSAQKNKVIPIKFFGDYYSCVSSIPEHNPRHANSCILLAFDMILKTRSMSETDALDIDMRIGVHSGEVFSALVGHTKWEFDIWSQDVEIAHRLESLGSRGRVHVSQTTLNFLNNQYDFGPGTKLAKKDLQLKKADIITFEINPIEPQATSSVNIISRFTVNSVEKELEEHHEDELKIYHGMREKVKTMPIGAIQMARLFMFSEERRADHVFHSYISKVFRVFRKQHLKFNFKNQPDIFMKYSLLMMVLVSFGFIIENALPPTSPYLDIIVYMVLALMLLCFICFYKMIVLHLGKQPTTYKPKLFIHWWLFKLSESFESKYRWRSKIYFVSIFLVYFIGTLNRTVILADETHISHIKEKFLQYWEASANGVLVLTIVYLTGLPDIFKCALLSCVGSLHVLTVHSFYHGWEFECIWYIISFVLVLLFMELHYTYLKKVVFYYKSRTLETHSQTENSKRTMKTLLCNILPSHVAPLFLNRRHSEELFHESHNKVAVMFASIVNFERDITSLRVLNEYVSRFDDLLLDYLNNFKVEKIKVQDWTYMSACGLHVDNQPHPSDASVHARFEHPLLELDDNCVPTMVNFAVEMLRIMHDIALENQYLPYGGSMRGQLKVGISHGPIVAGVVGSNHPHYDIWGQTVNMASHLCNTGAVGSIQVNDATAQVLRRFDIECSYRNTTNVLDLGKIISYLVDLDERLNLQHVEEIELDIIRFADSVDERPQISEADKVIHFESTDEDDNIDNQEAKNA